MDYKDIKLIKKGKVATIMIDRPDVVNAIRFITMLEIEDALKNIINDEKIMVVVLTGSGDKAFVSGGDISIMNSGTGFIETAYEIPKGQAICAEIENFPKPVIARINGLAFGGGMELALCCDIRIAASHVKMGLPEIKLGIIPGYGGTQRLPRIVGAAKAKELVMTGDPISAEEALRLGIVNQVVSSDELDAAVEKMVEKISSKGPFALYMAKMAINNGTQADLKTGTILEALCFSLAMGTEDKTEGMSAFLEKRKPQFKGR